MKQQYLRGTEEIVAIDIGPEGGEGIFSDWVKKIGVLSGQKVDWRFHCGRAIVRYVGIRSYVLDAILRTPLPERLPDPLVDRYFKGNKMEVLQWYK